MNETIIEEEANPEIIHVAAVRLKSSPNRAQRNALFVELGTLAVPEGQIRMYANKRDGSLIAILPDNQAFGVDTALFGSQVYKYWKKFSLGQMVETILDQTAQPGEGIEPHAPVQLFGADGNPIV